VLALPFVTRWICLWQIPDVALVFKVEEITDPEVPDDQNAYKVYSHVMEVLSSRSTQTAETSGSTSAATNSDASLADRMMAHNEQALAEYIRAGKMERAGGPSLKAMTIWTDISFYQHLRQLVRTYNSLGVTFEEYGEIEKAWDCHRANLQFSIHAEQTHQALCGLIACALRSMSVDGIVHWASNPSITEDRLHAARVEIEHEFARRTPFGAFTRGEYLIVRNSLNELAIVDEVLPTDSTGSPTPTALQVGKRSLLWCFAQPELALRMNRQVLLNNAQELEKPLHERRHSSQRANVFVFDLDPKAQRVSGQLSAEQLVGILQSESPALRLNRSMLPAMSQVDQARRRDSARFATLMVLFAAHEYQRTHGGFPETIGLLVPAYLNEIPFDPMEPTGKQINYRREADGTAVVWSVGVNGIDDQGDIASTQYLDTGYQIKLNQPNAADTTKLGSQ